MIDGGVLAQIVPGRADRGIEPQIRGFPLAGRRHDAHDPQYRDDSLEFVEFELK